MNDTTGTGHDVAKGLAALIPHAITAAEPVALTCSHTCTTKFNVSKRAAIESSQKDGIVIMIEQHSNVDHASTLANHLREAAIELGHNFTSVNLTKDVTHIVSDSSVDWGTNHLELDIVAINASTAAKKIFEWLCKPRPNTFRTLAAY